MKIPTTNNKRTMSLARLFQSTNVSPYALVLANRRVKSVAGTATTKLLTKPRDRKLNALTHFVMVSPSKLGGAKGFVLMIADAVLNDVTNADQRGVI
jgi:hypothetical protein